MYLSQFVRLVLAAAILSGSAVMAADEGVGPKRSNTRTQSDRNLYHNTSKSGTYAQRTSRATESGGGAATTGGAGVTGTATQLRGLQIAPAGVAVLGNNATTTGGTATLGGAANTGMGVGAGTNVAGIKSVPLGTGYGVGVPGTFTYLPGFGYLPGYPAVSVAGTAATTGYTGTAVEAGGAAEAPGVAPAAGALAGPGIAGGATVASPPGGSFAPPSAGYSVLPEATPGAVRQAMAQNPNWPTHHSNYLRSIPLEPGEASGAPMHTAAASPSVINARPAATGAGPLSTRARTFQHIAPNEPTIIDNSLRGTATGGLFARDASGRYGPTPPAGISGTPIAPLQPSTRPAITRDVTPR